MEVSLTEELEKPAEAPAPDTNALASQGTTAMAAPMGGYAEGMSGEFDHSDTKLPTLNIVHGVGPLSEDFTPGSLVYNKEHVLAEGDNKGCTPIEISVVAANKQYIENLEYGSDQMPMFVNTIEEVRAHDGTIAYGPNSEKPSWLPTLKALVLIKGTPETPGCDYVIGDDYYAAAVWNMKGSAYNRAGKAIITASKMGLRAAIAYGKWTLSVRREKLGDNFVHVPVLKQAGKNTDEFVAWVREIGLTF